MSKSKIIFDFFQCFINQASDVFLEFFLFLDHEDCCALGSTNKLLRTITSQDKLWIIYCKTRIGGFKDFIRTNEELHTIRTLLRFHNYKQLYHSLKSLSFPIFGCYRLLPSPDDKNSFQGGLYYIFPFEGMVLCQYVDYQGEIHLDQRAFSISFHEKENSLVAYRCQPNESNHGIEFDMNQYYYLSFQENNLEFNRTIQSSTCTCSNQSSPSATSSSSLSSRRKRKIKNQNNINSNINHHQNSFSFNFTIPFLSQQQCCYHEKFILSPIPSFLSSSIRNNLEKYQSFLDCVGLFTSRYGSHGNEILHLSLHTPDDSTFIRFPNNNNSTPSLDSLQLQGLKITGDKNVPAGNLSFVIDLSSIGDIQSTFLSDPRPIIMFPSNYQSPILTNWNNRINKIELLARGYGQINRIQGKWQPEWVICGFVLYKNPLSEQQKIVFSIIWDDEIDTYRHAMDFTIVPHNEFARQSFHQLNT